MSTFLDLPNNFIKNNIKMLTNVRILFLRLFYNKTKNFQIRHSKSTYTRSDSLTETFIEVYDQSIHSTNQ